MMMPILEQSPAHHHHHHNNYARETFYPQEPVLEQPTKIQLTLILPNGVPSVISVDANTPMMDLLVQAASLNKLNPSGYSLVVLDSNQHVIHFKANQTVGQIGSSTISLLPKEPTHSTPTSKTKTQPFEITVRLQVNLPDAQKILVRVDPTLPLYEIKEQICRQKKYTHSNQYTLRLPNKLDQPLALGLSLAEYKTNELTLIHDKQLEYEYQLNTNQLQSFDRLYRTRSESQPPKETLHEIQNEQQLNTNRSSTLRPSHTSLHAYWNDPNFDTQSQMSTCSSITKKRRAPRPPSYISPNQMEPQIVYIQQQQPPIHSPSPPMRLDHHQSRESLQSETTKVKRKAPVIMGKKDLVEKFGEQKLDSSNIARPGLEPPPPPPSSAPLPTNRESPSVDDVNGDITEQPVEDSSQTPTPIDTKLMIVTDSVESTITNAQQSPPSNHSPEQIQNESISLTPPIAEKQEQEQQQDEIVEEEPKEKTIEPPLQRSPIPKPPRQNLPNEKKSSAMDGLTRIIKDHTKRADTHPNTEKQTNENISYFRVAKSRFGKFETDSQGFVNNSIAIFDSTNQQKSDQPINKKSQSSQALNNSAQPKSLANPVQQQTKGKQAYNLLKKYEQEDQLQPSMNTDYLKTMNEKEKSPSPPMQLEVTERTTHITVTVESDRKQLIARASPISQQPSPPLPPPIVAPKPFGKTITEFRTLRRIGNGDHETIASTARHDVAASNETDNRRSTSIDSNPRLSSHEDLMESIRRFGGLQNLGKK